MSTYCRPLQQFTINRETAFQPYIDRPKSTALHSPKLQTTAPGSKEVGQPEQIEAHELGEYCPMLHSMQLTLLAYENDPAGQLICSTSPTIGAYAPSHCKYQVKLQMRSTTFTISISRSVIRFDPTYLPNKCLIQAFTHRLAHLICHLPTDSPTNSLIHLPADAPK